VCVTKVIVGLKVPQPKNWLKTIALGYARYVCMFGMSVPPPPQLSFATKISKRKQIQNKSRTLKLANCRNIKSTYGLWGAGGGAELGDEISDLGVVRC
jgi:hypothetical protein